MVYVHPDLRAAIERTASTTPVEHAALYFCSTLYIKASEKEKLTDSNVSKYREYFPLHSAISRKIYTTRNYGPMMAVLDQVGAVEQRRHGSYEVGKKAKSYRLAPKFWAAQPFEIAAPKLAQRIDRCFTRSSYAGMKSPAHKWIVESFKATSFSPDAASALAARAFATPDARHRAENHAANVQTQRVRFHVSKSSGRIYHSVANLPKMLRQELLIDGEATAEIDISCSQPSLLASLYLLDDLAHVAERQEYLDLLLSGTFYEQLAPGKDWDRAKIKTAFFNQIAYGSYYCSGKYELLPPFTQRFPILAGAMASVKKEGNKELPIKMQKLEADVVIAGACAECAKGQLKVLPVHDSLICKVSEAEMVAGIFKRNWDAQTQIPARFQISEKGKEPATFPPSS